MRSNFVTSCLLLTFCVSSLDAVKFRCDYAYYNAHGWFKYHEIPMVWRDARLQCQFEGGMLASPTSSEIKRIMKQSMPMNKVDIFTGIHATVAKGQYHTINGIPLTRFRHAWAESEPDNKNNAESCIAFNSDGNLSDVRCDEPRPFICHRKHLDIDPSACGTPDPEYHFETKTNKCYKLHTNPRTFERAFFVCSAEGGHLAIINSEDESAALRDIFAKYPAINMKGSFWKDIAYVGFHNWGESADWTTIHGQSLQAAGFSTFFAGEPNNATTGEYCGAMYRNGLLDDLWCENHYSFFCEKDRDYPPLCDSDNDYIDESMVRSQLNE